MEVSESPAISTYLYSLIAGPYKIYHDRYEDIPLRLLCAVNEFSICGSKNGSPTPNKA